MSCLDLDYVIEKGYVFYEDLLKEKSNIHDFFLMIKKCNRKIAVFYGNCQIYFLEEEILISSIFKEQYILVRIPAVHLFSEEQKQTGLWNDIAEYADLFVYQEVRDESKYGNLISSKVVAMLKMDCKKIRIPNVFFKGYHPQIIKNERNPMLNSVYNVGGIVPYGDSVLQNVFEADMSMRVLEEYLYSDDCISGNYIIKNLKDTLAELRRREETCDVVISDWIEQNYKDKYLFFVPSHPTNIVLYTLAKRILEKLGIETKNFTYLEGKNENNKFEMPIYPIVAKTLGLNFKKESFFFCRSLFDYRDSLLSYALKYRKYCFPELGQSYSRNNIIDLSNQVIYEEQYVVPRLKTALIYGHGSVHFSAYLTVKREIENVVIIHIPAEFAPDYTFRTVGMSIEGNYPVEVYGDGDVRINMPNKKSDILMIDAMWII